MGIPQRNALFLASVPTKDEFLTKHKSGSLNMPLLCNVRISRTVRGETSTDGVSQPVRFVNHTLESIEPVAQHPTAAPHAVYEEILRTLNKCPAHDDGLLFVFL